MSKGYLIFAQNNDSTDYVRQAYALALSIKHTQPNINSVTLCTLDKVNDKYKKVFDHILEIPGKDDAQDSGWKVENRWKALKMSPYEETVVLDADMLFTRNVELWWKNLSNYDISFTGNVIDYRKNVVTDDFYRKTFVKNELPNIYSAFYYFKKTQATADFFKMFQIVAHNWGEFYSEVCPKNKPQHMSIDVSTAVAAKVLGLQDTICNNFTTFVHMKPAIMQWEHRRPKWYGNIPVNVLDNMDILIGNLNQEPIIHYVEDDFLTDEILKKYEDAVL
jgi:hypothetical protein